MQQRGFKRTTIFKVGTNSPGVELKRYVPNRIYVGALALIHRQDLKIGVLPTDAGWSWNNEK